MNTAPDEASEALAQIRSRQEQVIKAALIPTWYWWVIGVGMVAIGAVADTKKAVALAIVIPIVAVAMAGLTVAMIVGAGRGARIKSNELLGGRGAALIVGFVWLIVGVSLGLAFGLRAAGTPSPGTIGTAAGGVLLILLGPVVTRMLNKIMMSNRAGLGQAGSNRTGLHW